MFNEALGRNTQLLNKKQAEGFTPKAAMQDPRQILPNFEKKNTELWLFYNETLNWRKRNSNWRKIAEICSGKFKKWWPKTPIYKNCTTKSSAQSPVRKYWNAGEATTGAISEKRAVFTWRIADDDKPSMKMNNKGTRTCMKKAKSCKTRMMRNIRRTGEKV